MRISLKIIIGLWIGLLLILGGLFYNAYSNFNPEAFLSIVNEQVEKNYPGAKLSIGGMDTRLSVDFNLIFKDIQLVREDKTLGIIQEVELRVPWWLLLFNRGNAQINISNFDLFIEQDFRPSIVDQSANKSSDNSIVVKLPNYLAGALYTFKAKNISVRDINTGRRYFSITKILIREFKYKKNSAFELTIPVELTHKGVNYNLELWAFGDLTPRKDVWKFNYRAEFRLNDAQDKFNLEDIIVDGKAEFKPHQFDVTSTLNLLVENETVGEGIVLANNSDINVNLKFDKLSQDYLQLVGEEMNNPYWTDLEGEAFGSISFQKSIKTGLTNLKGRMTFNGPLELFPGNSFDGKWVLDLQDRKWEVSFFSPKGEVSLFRRAVLDFDEGTVAQYTQELGFSGVDMTKVIQPLMSLAEFQKMKPTDYFTTSVSYKRCFLGNKIISGNFRYGVSLDQMYYQGQLTEEKNFLKINYLSKSSTQALDIDAKQFFWISNSKFLEPYFTASEGTLDGRVQGRWKAELWDGESLIQVKLTNVKDLGGEWIIFHDKVWKTFGLDSINNPNQQWGYILTNGALKVDSSLAGPDPAKVTGILSPNPQIKSFLTLSYPKNKKWRPVKKDITEPFFAKEQ